MSTVSCCLPAPIPTQRAWHQLLRDALRSRLAEARALWRRRRRAAACRALVRQMPRHTLQDLGLVDCTPPEPTLPRVDWEYGRWH